MWNNFMEQNLTNIFEESWMGVYMDSFLMHQGKIASGENKKPIP